VRLSDSIIVLLVRHNSYMQYDLIPLPVRVPINYCCIRIVFLTLTSNRISVLCVR